MVSQPWPRLPGDTAEPITRSSAPTKSGCWRREKRTGRSTPGFRPHLGLAASYLSSGQGGSQDSNRKKVNLERHGGRMSELRKEKVRRLAGREKREARAPCGEPAESSLHSAFKGGDLGGGSQSTSHQLFQVQPFQGPGRRLIGWHLCGVGAVISTCIWAWGQPWRMACLVLLLFLGWQSMYPS